MHASMILALLALVSCTKPQGNEGPGEISVSIPKNEVDNTASSQFIKVVASGAWSLNINCGLLEPWARVDTKSGTGDLSGVVLTWDANTAESERECELVLVSQGRKASATLTQEGTPAQTEPTPPSGTEELNPDPVASWLELPATDDKSLYFFTHDMTRGSRKVRNYSFYYDPVARISSWVAYPLNSGLRGTGSRSDEWTLDPKIPAKYQQILYRGYSSGYQRGHQIPSADRYGPGINEQTFYFINSTPQRGALNEQAWAKLEGYIRNWSNELDTLYVVTGADYKDATEYAYDNEGTAVPVPTGYYKALLAYKSGGSVANSTGGYFGIAFYFEHKGYSDSAIMGSQAMSIDALEEKMGMDFFVNLPAKLGEDVCKTIESSTDKTWWNNNK